MDAFSPPQIKEGVEFSSSNTEPTKDQEPLPSTHPSWNDERFFEYIVPLRTEMCYLGDDFLYLDSSKGYTYIPGGCEFWYGENYVKLIGTPGTLAGDILLWKSDLPRYNCNLEIIGNDVREGEQKKYPKYAGIDPDLEDCSEEVAKLPIIEFEPEKHFKKATTYKQEIRYLLQCQGSPRVVQVLGRTAEGELIFPRLKRSLWDILTRPDKVQSKGRVQDIRRWMLDIIDGVADLHSLGIIHRDLTARNILESDSLTMIICDLQCLNTTQFCGAFELDTFDGLDRSKYSFASDIFALGTLLWQCCFFNCPKNRHVLLANPPPPPFRAIFLACTQVKPEDRPTLTQLRAMYEAMEPTNE